MEKRKLVAVLIACVIVIGVLFFASEAFAAWRPGAGNQIIPCGKTIANGGVYQSECTFCHLLVLFQNLIDFLLLGIVPFLAGLMFIVAGIYWILGGANPAFHARGKSIFTNTFYAVVVIALAWLITNTIIINLGTTMQEGPWYQLECTATSSIPQPRPLPTPPPGPGPGPTPPPGGGVSVAVRGLALQIISRGIPLSASADCPPHMAQENIRNMSNGLFPYVCNPSCTLDSGPNPCIRGGTSGNVVVRVSVLEGLLTLWDSGVRFTITSLTTGRHNGGSSHYGGRGVDIAVTGGSSQYVVARDFLNARGGDAFCESNTGARIANCAIPPTDHIHWTAP